jgi:tRNA uridine 5-carboxymethylaminomethyl modification enzyme
MFTSRAEFRILLRQDDADERLTELSYKAGLASRDRIDVLEEKVRKRNGLVSFLKERSVSPGDVNRTLKQFGEAEIKQKMKAVRLVERPQIKIRDLWNVVTGLADFMEDNLGVNRDDEIVESAEVSIKYAGYIERERNIAEKIKRLEKITIPEAIDYAGLTSLSTEARQKLSRIRPRTVGQASRISGVSPSDISVLLVHMGR